MATFILKKDNLKLGLILGIIGPLVALVIIYFLKFPSYGFINFLDDFIHTNKLITSVGSLCLLANAILFTIYVNTQRDNTAKGIFIVTLIFGIAILLMKLFN
ncbi:MAG: hypothetical protein JSU05_01350 [Bacteroidetes bacterium]|nr:hypothetical protein [Bacteroidota bacterium]